MTSGEDKKLIGNEFFKNKNYQFALDSYREALDVSPLDHTLYSNSALCCLKLNLLERAVELSTECIRLHPSFAKGHFRRGIAYEGLKMWKEAIADLEMSVKLVPHDSLAFKSLEECKKALMAEKFASAIRMDKFDLDLKKINSIEMGDDYTGPRINNSMISFEFVKDLIQHYRKEQKLHKKFLYLIMYHAKQLFEKEENIHPVKRTTKVIICGDIHGQFFDLLEIFGKLGYPSSDSTFIFNGDFVDRGAHSVEVITLLLALKVCFPNNFFLSRGNHESPSVNRINSFYPEVIKKYDEQVYEMFSKVFNTLPIGYVLDLEYLIVHGGLPAKIMSIREINQLDRFLTPENGTIISQILWSDPQLKPGLAPSPRGEGVLFGPDHTKKFLSHNNLKRLIRSHVWEPNGFKEEHDQQCITIFSAPNYTGEPSMAAVILITEGNFSYVHFEAAKYQGKAQKPRPNIPTLY